MLTLKVNGIRGEYNVNIPTNINEITKEYIYNVTEHVKVAPNYTLIGTIFREKLSTIILSARNRKKDASVSVIPIYVKHGETNDDFIINLEPKEKLVISPSDIMMGFHVSVPNNLLTINTIMDLIEGDVNIFQKTKNNNDYCYFIEFKLIPNCNIHGSYAPIDKEFENPFIIKTNTSDITI